MAQLTKIDSNVTELRYCEEDSYKTVSGDEIWFPLEPNSYADFGGENTLTPRNPINSSRQRKKGVITDLDASGGFENDVTQKNLQRLLQGFFFADLRRKNDVGLYESRGGGDTGEYADYTITDIDTTSDEITVDSRVAVSAVVVAGGASYAVGDVVEVTDVNATVNVRLVVTGVAAGAVTTLALSYTGGTTPIYGNEGRTDTDTGAGAATTKVTGSGDDNLTVTVTYGNGLTWQAGDLIFLSGNNDSANDGLKSVASVSDNVITVDQNLTTDASPASTAKMSTVGFEGAAGDIDVDASGSLPTLVSAVADFTTLGLVPGEWIYIGGDTAGTLFSNAVNNGFARVRSIEAHILTLDKTENTMVTEASTTETIHLYFGRVLKNETGSSIRRRTYQLERTLGAPDDAAPSDIQSEYLTGAVPSELEIRIPAAAKIMANLSFVAGDNEQRTAAQGVKTGTRPDLEEADAFNTSSDIPRIKLSTVSDADSNPDALFAFVTELSIMLTNNLTPEKAVGVLGAFEVSAGTFEVGGEMTAYFADIAAVQAVRNNEDVTFDVHLVKDNGGISFDMPLIALGNARLNVEQDQAIKLPLSNSAATGAKVDPALNHTLLMVFWDYLPDAAS